MYSPANRSTGMNWHKDILKAWTPENPDSNIPRLQYEDKDYNNTSDRFLTDASYLNLQNHKNSRLTDSESTYHARMYGTGQGERASTRVIHTAVPQARLPILRCARFPEASIFNFN